MRNARCKKSETEITQALTGTWREEHLFVLKQSLALYDFYTQQISACDTQIEQNYGAMRPEWELPAEAPAPAPKRLAKNAPKEGAQLRQHLKRICGVDLVKVDGISVSLAQTILAEIGTDMSKFPSENTSVLGSG